MKKLIAVMLTLCMLCAASAALADKLVMATNAAFAPYEYVDETMTQYGGFGGIDVEIADLLAKKLGYEGVEVADMEFDSVILSVQQGKADIAMAGLTANAERMANVYFSFPYTTGVQVIIVKEGSPITTADDLFVEGKNYTIGVQMATTGDLYCTWDIEDEGLGTVSRFPTGAEAVMALISGKVDCVVIDNEPAKAFVAANEGAGLMILDTEYVEEDYAIAVAKDDTEFLGKLSAAMQDMMADGTIQAIVEKYIPAEEAE